MFDSENQLKPAHLPLECHHGSPPSSCPHNDPQARYRCPTADEIKYRMTRLAVDALDIYLVESGTAINLWVMSSFYFFKLDILSIIIINIPILTIHKYYFMII